MNQKIEQMSQKINKVCNAPKKDCTSLKKIVQDIVTNNEASRTVANLEKDLNGRHNTPSYSQVAFYSSQGSSGSSYLHHTHHSTQPFIMAQSVTSDNQCETRFSITASDTLSAKFNWLSFGEVRPSELTRI